MKMQITGRLLKENVRILENIRLSNSITSKIFYTASWQVAQKHMDEFLQITRTIEKCNDRNSKIIDMKMDFKIGTSILAFKEKNNLSKTQILNALTVLSEKYKFEFNQAIANTQGVAYVINMSSSRQMKNKISELTSFYDFQTRSEFIVTCVEFAQENQNLLHSFVLTKNEL